MGVILRGAWGYVFRCITSSCIVERVHLGVGVVVGLSAPVASKMLASCQMISMVWAPKQVKGAAVAGFSRASDRRLAASVAALAE